ncbi:MAG: vWA domain-containing protein, partial [Pirellulales bacterium]
MTLLNTLGVWPWAILAIIPPAIVALYFLKLRRRPVEVSSTYLWRRSIEDLHVNSLWQRLRRNLLLLLQLILLALLMLALLRPSWRGEQLLGDRFVFLIDNSASMRATDVAGSRLDEAKRRAGRMIDRMHAGREAMIVSFADTAEVVQSFTGDRDVLRQRLAEIAPTDRRTSIREALKVIAGATKRATGISPGQDGPHPNPLPEGEGTAVPTILYLLSDGRFPAVDDVRLGNTEVVFLPVGSKTAANVAVTAFAVRRHETDPDRLQAIAR